MSHDVSILMSFRSLWWYPAIGHIIIKHPFEAVHRTRATRYPQSGLKACTANAERSRVLAGAGGSAFRVKFRVPTGHGTRPLARTDSVLCSTKRIYVLISILTLNSLQFGYLSNSLLS